MISIKHRPKVVQRPGISIRDRVKPNRPELGLPSREPQPVENGPVDQAPEPRPAKPQYSLSSLNAAQKAASAALPATAAVALNQVWGAMEGQTVSQGHLLGLLESGTLGQTFEGRTVVESLGELTTESRAQGMDGAVITRETVAMLADPNEYVAQGKVRTCGATNIQRQLASEPARYAYLVEDLTEADGATRDGLARNDSSLAYDDSDRNLTNRLVQGALMSAAGGPAHGQYNGETDRFADGGAGLQLLEVASLTGHLEGNRQGVVIHNTPSTYALREMISEMPEGETFQAAVSWNGVDHLLLVTGHNEGEIQYYNPDQFDQRTGSMPMHEFLFKTQAVILEQDQIEGLKLPQEAEVYWPEGA